MTEGSGLYLAGPALVKAAIGQAVEPRGRSAARRCTPRSAARSTSASRTTPPAWSGCGGWSRRCRPTPPRVELDRRAGPARAELLDARSPTAAAGVRRPRPAAAASSTTARSTSTRPSTARRSSAATAGSAACRSASSPISGSACKPADGPLQFGGVIYVDSADKAARFVMDCNQTPRADPLPAGRQRLHGRPRLGAGRHHPRRGEAGQRHRQQRRAEDHASSSAARSAPATTPCAARRSTRGSSSPGRRRSTPSWAATRRRARCSTSRCRR